MLDSSPSFEKEKASAPLGLVSEAPRPMPKNSELKLGAMGPDIAASSAANSGSTRFFFHLLLFIVIILIFLHLIHRND